MPWGWGHAPSLPTGPHLPTPTPFPGALGFLGFGCFIALGRPFHPPGLGWD